MRLICLFLGFVFVRAIDTVAALSLNVDTLDATRYLGEKAKTIAEIVADDADLTTLASALKVADLVETLGGDGPFTVFAPTNDAFSMFPADELKALLEDKAELAKVLLYHVVAGEVNSSQIFDGMQLVSLGGNITVNVTNDGILLDGYANVTKPDILASNGIIHILDQVLLPLGPEVEQGGGTNASDTSSTQEDTVSEQQRSATPTNTTITDVAFGNDDFSTLASILNMTGLAEILAGDGEFTVFAPTDAAFEGLGVSFLDSMFFDISGTKDILLYHVLNSTILSSQMILGQELVTLQGEVINVTAISPDVVLNDKAKVVTPDIVTGNGVIHVIDAVLLPSTMAMGDVGDAGNETGTIADIVSGTDGLSVLAGVLSLSGLMTDLMGEGNFTLFAPSDDAFGKLDPQDLASLALDIDELVNVLQYHVVAEKILSTEFVVDEILPTLEGQDIKVTSVEPEIILNAEATVTKGDIMTLNGVIHVIDTVLFPPEASDTSVESQTGP